jgi:hypothetical protein
MATTDTSVRTIRCPCGVGEIRITTTSPDHPWVTAYNVHHSYAMLCKLCDDQYMIDDSGLVYLRSEKLARQEADSQLRHAQKEFDSLPAVIEVREAFGTYLDGLRRTAAHRLLTEHGLEYGSIGSFRRNWHGGQTWASQHVASYNFRKVLALLDHDDSRFVGKLRNIEELGKAVPGVRTVMRCHG